MRVGAIALALVTLGLAIGCDGPDEPTAPTRSDRSTTTALDPVDVAENMKKFGGYIPGIRPGKKTAEYIDRVLTRLTLGGALYISAKSVASVVGQLVAAREALKWAALPAGFKGQVIQRGTGNIQAAQQAIEQWRAAHSW